MVPQTSPARGEKALCPLDSWRSSVGGGRRLESRNTVLPSCRLHALRAKHSGKHRLRGGVPEPEHSRLRRSGPQRCRGSREMPQDKAGGGPVENRPGRRELRRAYGSSPDEGGAAPLCGGGSRRLQQRGARNEKGHPSTI